MSAWRDKIAERVLLDLRIQLVNDLKLPKQKGLLVILLESEKHLTRDEVEMILSRKTNSGRVGKLLDYLTCRLTTKVFNFFVDAVGDEEINGNPDLAKLLRDKYRELQGGKVEMESDSGKHSQRKQKETQYLGPAVTKTYSEPSPYRPVRSTRPSASRDGVDSVKPSYFFSSSSCEKGKSYLISPQHRCLARFNHKSGDSGKIEIHLNLPQEMPPHTFLRQVRKNDFVGVHGRYLKMLKLKSETVRHDVFGDTRKLELVSVPVNNSSVAGRFTCFVYSGDNIFVGTDKGSVEVYKPDFDKKTFEILQECHDADDPIEGMCLSIDTTPNRIAVWRASGLVEVGSGDSMYLREYSRKFTARIRTCSFAESDRISIIIQNDGGAKVVQWKFASNDLLPDMLIGAVRPDEEISVGHDGSELFVATQSFQMKVNGTGARIPWDGNVQWVTAVDQKWLICVNGRVMSRPFAS